MLNTRFTFILNSIQNHDDCVKRKGEVKHTDNDERDYRVIIEKTFFSFSIFDIYFVNQKINRLYKQISTAFCDTKKNQSILEKKEVHTAIFKGDCITAGKMGNYCDCELHIMQYCCQDKVNVRQIKYTNSERIATLI